MKTVWFRFCLIMAGFLLIHPSGLSIAEQSLVDAARREAERRNRIEELGIEETVIEGNGEGYAGKGNVSVFSSSGPKTDKGSVAPSSPKPKGSLDRYKKTLQKLDQDIRKGQERIENLKERLEDLRRKSFGIGDLTTRRRNDELQDRTREQIEELEVDLKLKRKERNDVYDSGRKAGFLPGELDGKGIIP